MNEVNTPFVEILGGEKCIVLNHSDEVSGTTILPDGTKAHWTEGRSSTIICVRPDGQEFEIDACPLSDETPERLVIGSLIEWFTMNASEYRQMTAEEETEIAVARGWTLR